MSGAAGREPSMCPAVSRRNAESRVSIHKTAPVRAGEREDFGIEDDGSGHEPYHFSSFSTHGHTMRITFSVEMIHEIHAEIIDTFRELAQRNGDDETGIVYEVRDPGTLAFIVLAINLASTPVEQAAVALHRIASQHPYFDGNKRTAGTWRMRSPTTNSSSALHDTRPAWTTPRPGFLEK